MLKKLILLLLVFIMLIFTSCTSYSEATDKTSIDFTDIPSLMPTLESDLAVSSDKNITNEKKYNLFYLNKSGDELVPELRVIEPNGEDDFYKVLLTELLKGNENTDLRNPLKRSLNVNKVICYGDLAEVDLDYAEFWVNDETAARAAIVNTLTDLSNINYVKITINGNRYYHDENDDGVNSEIFSKYSISLAEIQAKETRKPSLTDPIEENQIVYYQDLNKSYLIPCVKKISTNKDNVAKSVLQELLVGPEEKNNGYYPVMPEGTKIERFTKISNRYGNGILIQFSKEFKNNFNTDDYNEENLISSIVLTLTNFMDVDWVSVSYVDEKNIMKNDPLDKIQLDKIFRKYHFNNKIGKLIKVYFPLTDENMLCSEYRAVSLDGDADNIIEELIKGPLDERCIPIIQGLEIDDIEVYQHEKIIYINIVKLNAGTILTKGYEKISLLAIVNTMTDPENLLWSESVQFLINNVRIEKYNNVYLKEPFIRNSMLIKK